MIQKISESLYLFRAAIFQFGVKKAILKVPLSGIFVIHLTNFIKYLCINCPLLEYCVFIVFVKLVESMPDEVGRHLILSELTKNEYMV